MTNLAEQPGAPAVVLLREELADDPNNFHSTYVRIKVLAEAGRRYADVEIPYSRRHFTIGEISGRTIHADGSIVPFDGKVFDKVLLRTKGYGKEERYQVKSFTLPDVQIGSIFEYRYVLRYDDRSFYSPDWQVQEDLFQKKANFKFIPYDGLLSLPHDRIGRGVAWTSYLPTGIKPELHDTPHSGVVSSRTASSYVDLSMTSVPALTHEPYMPPESALRYRVKFYYLVGQKQEEFWKDEGKFWSKDVESFVGKKDGVAEAVSQTVGASDSAEDKVKKIYAYVGRLDNWSYLPPREAKEEKALAGCGKTPAMVSLVCDAEGGVRE